MTIADNLQQVREHIAEAAARSGRKASDITLVAVTKTFPVETILEGYTAGLRHFGENRVQEAAEKIPPVLAQAPQAHWHLIGHLQRNKIKRACELFSLVHSVDSLRLAQAISQQCALLHKQLPILLELNLTGEDTKSGFRLGGDLSPFWREVEQICALSNVQVQGLMTVGAYSPRMEDARPVFERLRHLRDEAAQRMGGEWPHLSMGMSGDFVIAIEAGATLVRIGTAIFGERAAK
jgi:hypothetical protein